MGKPIEVQHRFRIFLRNSPDLWPVKAGFRAWSDKETGFSERISPVFASYETPHWRGNSIRRPEGPRIDAGTGARCCFTCAFRMLTFSSH